MNARTTRYIDAAMIAAIAASGVCYVIAVVLGAREPARLAGLLLSAALTARLFRRVHAESPKGTAMVVVAACVLILEGSARSAIDGTDEPSFLEICIGLYLAFASRMLLRRSL